VLKEVVVLLEQLRSNLQRASHRLHAHMGSCWVADRVLDLPLVNASQLLPRDDCIPSVQSPSHRAC
jgi:hypothetical protein